MAWIFYLGIQFKCRKIALYLPKYHLRFTCDLAKKHHYSLYFLHEQHGKFTCGGLGTFISPTFKNGRYSKVLQRQFKMETYYWEYVWKQKYFSSCFIHSLWPTFARPSGFLAAVLWKWLHLWRGTDIF